jgi:hypothetical protein
LEMPPPGPIPPMAPAPPIAMLSTSTQSRRVRVLVLGRLKI